MELSPNQLRYLTRQALKRGIECPTSEQLADVLSSLGRQARSYFKNIDSSLAAGVQRYHEDAAYRAKKTQQGREYRKGLIAKRDSAEAAEIADREMMWNSIWSGHGQPSTISGEL
jgi:hypothetical protein